MKRLCGFGCRTMIRCCLATLLLAALALSGPVEQCLEHKCRPFYSACDLLPKCRTVLIGCLNNCSTSAACETNCFTKAINGSLGSVTTGAIISLDICGGYGGCFPTVAASNVPTYGCFHGICTPFKYGPFKSKHDCSTQCVASERSVVL